MKNLFVLAAAKTAGDFFWPVFALLLGCIAGALFYVPKVFVPLAHSEIARIQSLDEPRPHHFFHKGRLLCLVVCIPCLVFVSHSTEEHLLSNLIFGGMVAPISLGLSCGSCIMLRRWWNFDAEAAAAAAAADLGGALDDSAAPGV